MDILHLPRIERILFRPARSQVTIPTELSEVLGNTTETKKNLGCTLNWRERICRKSIMQNDANVC